MSILLSVKKARTAEIRDEYRPTHGPPQGVVIHQQIVTNDLQSKIKPNYGTKPWHTEKDKGVDEKNCEAESKQGGDARERDSARPGRFWEE